LLVAERVVCVTGVCKQNYLGILVLRIKWIYGGRWGPGSREVKCGREMRVNNE